MKITAVQAIVLRLPDINTAADGTQDTCLIRIETDAGITGWGEVDSAPTVVRAAVEAPLSNGITRGVASALEGADPLAIDACMQRIYDLTQYFTRYGAGAHAVAGVNIALWDIAGKAYGQPIYRLFGAEQRQVRAYASVLFQDTPAATYELAARLADRGFTAAKFGWGPMGQSEANDIALVREARRGLGEDVDLMIDAGQPWDWRTALVRSRQFAEFRPFWLEEPLHPEDVAGYAKLTAVSEIPDCRRRVGVPADRFRGVDRGGRVGLGAGRSRPLRALDHGRRGTPCRPASTPVRESHVQDRRVDRGLAARAGGGAEHAGARIRDDRVTDPARVDLRRLRARRRLGRPVRRAGPRRDDQRGDAGAVRGGLAGLTAHQG